MGLPGRPQFGPIDRNALKGSLNAFKDSIDTAYADMTGDPVALSQEDIAELFPNLSQTVPLMPVASPADRQRRKGVSDEQTVNYQRKSVRAELMLLQKHLREGCQIDGIACDCCEKHPEQLEALALESYGMTADPVYMQVAQWARKVEPITTQEASESGQYADVYPQLALEARELIKTLMGSGYAEGADNGS